MVRNDAEKEKKEVHREKFSQVATSPGAHRCKTRPIEQNPAPVTRISQKRTSLIHSADTCPAKGEAPARPGRENERPFAPFSNLNFFVKNRQNFFAIELMNIH